ncbi:MAG: hypothetical protein K0U98_20140 [Deltaproteobacteria bacterium]|nr:hypothetical protein [Deltaproteobacteria bacterium]
MNGNLRIGEWLLEVALGILNWLGDVVVGASSISHNHATVRGGGYANANVGGGAVIVLPTSSYSGNTAGSACDKYYDIHRTPACVN